MAVEHKYVRKDYNLSYNILPNWDSPVETDSIRILFSVGWYRFTLRTQEVTIFDIS